MRLSISALGQNRILGGAVVLSLTQFGASLMGLIRDRILAKTFPDLDVVDVYIASFRPSDLLFQVCIMAGFSVALVPMLASYKAKKNEEAMGSLLNGAVGLAACVFGVIALVVALIFPMIAERIVQFDGEQLALYIQFGRLALLTNFLFVFGNAFGQYLVTVQRYWIYGLTPILYTLGTILGTIFLTPIIGPYGPMAGTVLGAIVYVLFRVGAVLSSGFTLKLRLWHEDLNEMFWLMLPRMLALGILQLQFLFFDSIASGLETGAITINAYARNFQAVAVGVAGIALAQSAYSLLSQAAAKKEQKRFLIYLRKGIFILLVVTIPGAIALIFLAPFAAYLVGLSEVYAIFSVCLALYAISIPFESINHLMLRAFYATKQTVIPATFSVLNGLTAITVSWLLAPSLSVFALALGFTSGQIVQLIGLGAFLPSQLKKMR